MQSHIRKEYACLAVTCHLHFWQNDRDLLRATAATVGTCGLMTCVFLTWCLRTCDLVFKDLWFDSFWFDDLVFEDLWFEDSVL